MTQNAGKVFQHISGAYLCTRAGTSSDGGIKDSGQEFKLFVARWQPDTVIITPRSYNSGIPLMSAPILQTPRGSQMVAEPSNYPL